MQIDNRIVELSAQVRKAQEEITRLRTLQADFPDAALQKRYRSQEWIVLSRDSIPKSTSVETRHTCGCCDDAGLDAWLYLDTPHGRVYTACLIIGRKAGDTSYLTPGWRQSGEKIGAPTLLLDHIACLYSEREEDPEP